LDDTVRALSDEGERVRVEFVNGRARDFDLVVGGRPALPGKKIDF